MKASELVEGEGRDWDAKPPRTLSEVLERFEEWIEVTGFIGHGTSYYWELRSFFDEDVKNLPALRHHDALVAALRSTSEFVHCGYRKHIGENCHRCSDSVELLATIEKESKV